MISSRSLLLRPHGPSSVRSLIRVPGREEGSVLPRWAYVAVGRVEHISTRCAGMTGNQCAPGRTELGLKFGCRPLSFRFFWRVSQICRFVEFVVGTRRGDLEPRAPCRVARADAAGLRWIQR